MPAKSHYQNLSLYSSSIWASSGLVLNRNTRSTQARYARSDIGKKVPYKVVPGLRDLQSSKSTTIAMFSTDIFLLVTTLAGLLRLDHQGSRTFELGHLFWKQVIWRVFF
jgi:hypothetical protein